MSLLITGATIVDGVADQPLEGQTIWMQGSRIKAIGRRDELPEASGVKVIDARGKYIIPGLMNANVHLLGDVLLENLARHEGRYEDLIAEAAQVALKNGLTTVFDTWGPRRFLIAVRERINANELVGARIFCAGNIVGFDGPYSPDFAEQTTAVASVGVVTRINALWVENVGRHLMWQTPERVASELRAYISRGVDFIKYAANDHAPGAFLAFSPRVQATMVEEAHRAGITAQAHTMTVEGLRIAMDAGCDLIQHANITGPVPIPETTLELLSKRKPYAVVFPFTQRRLQSMMENAADRPRTMWMASDTNARNLIRSGASLLLGTDGAVFAPEVAVDRLMSNFWGEAGDDRLIDLATGHIAWFKAMEEKGCPPMRMLQAATRNIALAYGKDKDLGTLEPGKLADMVILDKNPLEAAVNYASIHQVLKEGVVVDRDSLPLNPILTRPPAPLTDEERAYVPFYSRRHVPMCPACMSR